MPSIFGNFNSGAVDTANLLIAGTTINSAAFSTLPTVAAPDTLWITLDPTGIAGNPEIVQVTTHTAAATSCTIVRAQQGTTARQHNIGALWAHASSKSDFDELPFRKLTTTGDLLYGSAANTATRLPVGGTGGILSVAAGIPSWVAIGATGTQLTVVGGVPTWRADTTNTVADAKGDLLAGTAADTIAALTVGTNDTRLVADSTQATGLRWAPDSEYKIVDAKGDLIVGSADNTVVRKAVGADATFLMADAASAGGIKWAGAATAYTPAITWSGWVVGSVVGNSLQIGKALLVWGSFALTSGGGAGAYTLPLPAGYTFAATTSITVISSAGGGFQGTGASAASSYVSPATFVPTAISFSYFGVALVN